MRWLRAARAASRRGADGPPAECDCADRRRSRGLLALVAAAPLATAILRALDSLTPTFSGVLSFRARVAGGMALLAFMAVAGLVVARRRHRRSSAAHPPSSLPLPPVHYSYPPLARRVAKVGAIAAAAVLAWSIADLRDFRGDPGPVRVRVSEAGGLPAAAVWIDLLDLDRQPVTRAPAVTDAFGVAILDVLDGRGRPVYLSTRSQAEPCEGLIRMPAAGPLRRFTWNEWERSQPSTALPIECPAQAAVVIPFSLPVTSGVERPPVVSGPWPADPWMVDVLLRTPFSGSESDVTVTVVAPEGASAHRRDLPQRNGAHWMVRPSARSPERPTQVTLLAAAPGQKPVRLHLGPLTFVRRGASEVAEIETEIPFEPDLVPAVTRVARVLRKPGEAAAFDVTIANPLDREVAITRVVVEAAQPRPPLMRCTGGVSTYDTSLTVSVRRLRPSAEPGVNFPVHGTLSRFCAATEMQAAIAFDHALPARETTVLRFVVYEGLKRQRTRPAPLGPVLNDREYDWTLRLELDRELVITGDYHPPRAVFGR